MCNVRSLRLLCKGRFITNPMISIIPVPEALSSRLSGISPPNPLDLARNVGDTGLEDLVLESLLLGLALSFASWAIWKVMLHKKQMVVYSCCLEIVVASEDPMHRTW